MRPLDLYASFLTDLYDSDQRGEFRQAVERWYKLALTIRLRLRIVSFILVLVALFSAFIMTYGAICLCEHPHGFGLALGWFLLLDGLYLMLRTAKAGYKVNEAKFYGNILIVALGETRARWVEQ